MSNIKKVTWNLTNNYFVKKAKNNGLLLHVVFSQCADYDKTLTDLTDKTMPEC